MGVEGVDKTKVEGVDEVKSGRRIRLLCFHGFRTSAQILEKQLGKWDASIHDLLDLTFLQAPFPAEGKSDVESIFPPPYFEWFSFNKAFTEYVGVQEAVEYISKYMKQNGPFDGFLGFSQGAILSAYLVSLQEKGLALQDVEPLRLIVIISGAKFPSSKMELAYRETIRCPSIHFIGEKDYLKTPGEELVKLFQSPFIIRHSYGHTIPRLDADTTLKVVDYLKQERDKLSLPSRTDEDSISKDEDETLQKTDYCVKNLDA
ncbi:hypothetical protein O6H91_15G035200 [Diphasiastrum complanatum]|uniref:Uncharacterized protein n=2 Tax=Diphasiastrum complanatum TaxID=34168 RepID=A0ACC2BHE0_DIPCM|nr:hypothetical protein O6H91_15G035200 [Diphasiastrum complanatum]KAJ7529135.1 hypothetical protein O6H91_15G035200 [Diphasiastrum complanatum]